MKSKFTPLILLQTFLVLMLITLLLPLEKYIVYPFNMFGFILLIIGSFAALHTKKMFLKTKTPTMPNAKPIKLLTMGAFKYTRNPMYLGITIGLLGIALMTSILLNLIFPILFMYLTDKYFVGMEEDKLEKEFGEEYLRYKMNTRRWF